MKHLFTIVVMALICAVAVQAQRRTDKLNRGLVALKTQTGVFVSWRIPAEEYYDVTYNVYRNGMLLNSKPLEVSNFQDASGSASDRYTVAAIVNGVVQSQCAAVTPWSEGRIDGARPCPPYKEIMMQPITSRKGVDITSQYVINDVSMADLDGDGEIEFIVKRINQKDADDLFPYVALNDYAADHGFTMLEAYKMNGTKLWSIDVGPNMVSGGNHEVNIVAFDWDQDGKAEVLLRGADAMRLYKARNRVETVGKSYINTRNTIKHTANMTYTNSGSEFLLYLNGETLEPYWIIDYPLPRGNASDWGDTYGHRSSKYFFGAPYLDGRNPSMFLARGIYTKTEMVAYDVNPSTHEITKRWNWSSGNSGSWFGQGYHNFGIADVDLDGRDEIVYGSMVIDDNGKGLSTTGLGHGDAQHCGDLDPFRKGLEIFACNEDNPGSNYRNATTSEIYIRHTASGDDGRAMAGNFTNNYPGCIAASASSGVFSLASDQTISGMTNNWAVSTPDPMALNFRIYWDGDLLEETVNSPGTERDCVVLKAGAGRIMQTSGCAMVNYTKNNPSAQGDIIGDWREELILRTADNKALRIYSTMIPTEYRIPCLWHDHQYRQSMVWQMLAYNQPPHTSFFIGEMEGLTVAPPPLTTVDRVELGYGSIITSAQNGKHVLLHNAVQVGLEDGVEPSVITVNAPITVSGTGNNANIQTTSTYTQLGTALSSGTYKGTIVGKTRLVKQGEGELRLTAREHTYSGNTDIWGGSFAFNGKLPNSAVWMNRHTALTSHGGTFGKSVTMEYGSTISAGYGVSGAYGTLTVNELNMHEGSRIVFDVEKDGETDVLNIGKLSIRKQNWQYGPKYLAPVLQIVSKNGISRGKFLIGQLDKVEGKLSDIIIEGVSSSEVSLVHEDGKLYLQVGNQNDIVIGNENNTTGWWSDFSDYYTISNGQAWHAVFTNNNSLAKNWNNWLLVAANNNRGANGYGEHFVLRNDAYGWGNSHYNGANISHNFNWNNFVSEMNGSTVDMTVTYENNTLTMKAIITALSGNVYTYTYKQGSVTDSQVKLFLTVEKSHIIMKEENVCIYSVADYNYLNSLINEAQPMVNSREGVGTGLFMRSEANYNELYRATRVAKEAINNITSNTNLNALANRVANAIDAFKYELNEPDPYMTYWAKLTNANVYLNLSNGANNSITATSAMTGIMFESAGNGEWYIKSTNGAYLYYPNKSQNWVFGTSTTSKASWKIESDGNGAFYIWSTVIGGRAIGANYTDNGKDGSGVEGRKDPNNTNRNDINGKFTHWTFGEYGTNKAIELDEPEIEMTDGDANEPIVVAIYNVMGQKTSQMQRGVNIVVYSDGTSKKIIRK